MTTIVQISASQAAKEVTANEAFLALGPTGLFGRKYTTTAGLTWGYYGGILMVDGVLTTIADGTVALTASATQYLEATRAGVVSKNTTGFSAGRIPLYTVVTGASSITSYSDQRLTNPRRTGRLSKSVAGGANVTLTAAEARNEILELTGALTANINVIVPTVADQWVVYNNTTGAFTLTVKTAAGTGIAVQQGKRAILYGDETNVVSGVENVAALNVDGDLTLADAKNLIAGSTTGTKIATATTQKISLWNKTPIVQPTALTAADGSTVDGTYGAEEAAVIDNLRTRLGELETKLSAFGFLP